MLKTHRNQEMKKTANIQFQSFRLCPLSKNPTTEWSNKNRERDMKLRTIQQMIDDSSTGYGIICGLVNKICIVDLDFYKFDSETRRATSWANKFTCDFGEDFIDKFDTFTVLTASGGFHLYFIYDPRIGTKSSSATSVDTRSDGGYVVAPGTCIRLENSREIKKYTVLKDREIKKAPEALVLWLMNNLGSGSGSKKTRPNRTMPDEINIMTRINNQFKVSMSDEEILYFFDDGLPDKQFDDYILVQQFTVAIKSIDNPRIRDIWWAILNKRVADKRHFLEGSSWHLFGREKLYEKLNYTNMITLTNFLTGKAQKHSDQGKKMLPYIKIKELPCSHANLRMDSVIDKNFMMVPDVLVSREKLGYKSINEFRQAFKYVKMLLVRSDTATGKSTSVINYMIQTGMPMISIVSRRALGREQVRSWNKTLADAKSIEQFHYWEDIRDEIAEDRKSDKPWNQKSRWSHFKGYNIVCTVDSCDALMEFEDFAGYILYLDETNSLISYMLNTGYIDPKRIRLFGNIKRMVNTATFVIGTDADLSPSCMKLANFCGIEKADYKYINNAFQHNKGVKVYEVSDAQDIINMIKSEDKILVCCDSKTHVILLEKLSKVELGKIQSFVGGVEGDIDLDAHKKVIISPVVINGLDSVMRRRVVAFYACHSIGVNDMAQQVCRCRNIIDLTICFKNKPIQIPDFDDYDHAKTCIENRADNVRKSFETFGITQAPTDDEKAFNELMAMDAYITDCMNTNMFAHFLAKLEQKGFDVSAVRQKYVSFSDSSDIRVGSQRLTQERLDHLNDCVKQFNERGDDDTDFKPLPYNDLRALRRAKNIFDEDVLKRNEFLGIPWGIIIDKNYQKFLLDDYVVSDMKNYMKYQKNDKDNFENLAGKDDFNASKGTSTDMKIDHYKKFCQLIGMTQFETDTWTNECVDIIHRVSDEPEFLGKWDDGDEVWSEGAVEFNGVSGLRLKGLEPEISRDWYEKYRQIYKIRRGTKAPDLTDGSDCLKLWANMTRHLFGDEIIESKQSKKRSEGGMRIYKLNSNVIWEYGEIAGYVSKKS